MDAPLMRTASDWREFDKGAFTRPARLAGVLMGAPDFFDVVAVHNVFMKGNAGHVDRQAATRQWQELAARYRHVGIDVEVLPGQVGLHDLVFTANPCLVGLDLEGARIALLARMRHESRRAECDAHRRWLRKHAYTIHELPDDFAGSWEGGGDSIWHPDHYSIWGACGPRSDLAAYEYWNRSRSLPIAVVELVDPAFYHLDTCFAVIDADRAAWLPSAFSEASRELIESAFATLIEIDRREALDRLAGNLFCPDGRHVFQPSGCPKTAARLAQQGLKIIDVNTDEFLKSGGSIYCLRQGLYEH